MFLISFIFCVVIVPVCTQNYSDFCPPTYLNESGSIFFSPNYPEPYDNFLDCDYLVTAPEGSYITVTLQTFDVEYDDACVFDIFLVYDGLSTENDVLAELCGSRTPAPIFSNHNLMLMKFTTDTEIVASGFQGLVTFKKVKLLHFNESGAYFTSPNYPENYDDPNRFHYRATASPGQYIAVTFFSFDIQNSIDCSKGAVKIFDGNSSKASLLAMLCGSYENQTFFSSKNEVFISFTTDGSGTTSGFDGVFTFHEDTCRGVYNTSGSVISSPNFPQRYGNFVKCDFVVTIPEEGKVAEIIFSEFDLDDKESCSGDRVEIYDGGVVSEFPSVKLCGSTLPVPFISRSRFVVIKFMSDEWSSGSGFEMLVNFILDHCPPTYLNESDSVFFSPNYIDPYGSSVDCDYLVTAPEDSYIIVTFQAFNIEDYACEYGVLLVYDGQSTDDDFLTTLCRSRAPAPIFSNHNLMLMKFIKDAELVAPGFQGLVTFKKAKRPLWFNESGAYFTSPNYPENYNDFGRFHYRATASPWQYIAVTFYSFHIQNSTDCTKDAVEIFDGNSPKASVLVTLCGSFQQRTFFSSRNELFITYTTDGHGTNSGFEGVFTFHEDTCRGIYGISGSLISSPNYPQKYGNFVKCEFVVPILEEGKVAEIVFSDFDLGDKESCSGDRVEILDGGVISTFPSVKLCGSTLPSPFISHSSFVIIRFTSDGDSGNSGSGFQMQINFILEPCRTCDYLHRYYGECPEHSLPPSHDDQQKLEQLPPAEYLRCRSLTGKSTESYKGAATNLGPQSYHEVRYWMISECPKNTERDLVVLCTGIEGKADLIKTFTPPVLSSSLNVLFKNEYCARCNDVSRDDIEVLTVYSKCEQCPREYPIEEGEEIEVEPQSCQVLPNQTLLRTCSLENSIVCPVIKEPSLHYDSLGVSEIFSHAHVLLCSKDEVLLNGFCVKIPKYCNGSPTVAFLILTVDTLKYNCSYLRGRSEICFFEKFLSYEKSLQVDFLKSDNLFQTFSTLWKRTVRPMWWNSSESSQIFFILPKNLTSNLHWKQNLVSAIISIFHLGDTSSKLCYLHSIELFEACSSDEVTDFNLSCQGYVEDFEVDANQTMDVAIDLWRTNTKRYSGTPWYGHKTSLGLGVVSNFTKRLYVCMNDVNQEVKRNTFYLVFSNFCCVTAIAFLMLTFFVYATTSSLRNTFGTVLMIFVLSFALGLVVIQFVNPYITHIKWLCETFAIITHWLWISVFAWMTVLAFDLRETFNVKNMRVVNRISRKRLGCYIAISWGLPTLLVSACVIAWMTTSAPVFYGSRGEGTCWIYEHAAAAVVVSGPLVTCLCINIVLFILIIKGIFTHRANSRRAQLHSQQTTGSISELILTIKISVLMGFTWMFGYVAPLTNIEEFNYFFYLLILLQGVFIFAFFGASKRVRKQWRKKLETGLSTLSSSRSLPTAKTSDDL